MTTPISKLISPFLVSAIAIIVLLLHICISLWKHRRTRSSSAKDFKKLSNEATTLSAETERIRRAANESSTADRTVRIAHLALLCEADEWDTAIRICLVTWEDIILPNSSIGDEESGKRDAIGNGRQNGHGKQMIGVMHARCKEGLARRKELGPQLQLIHLSSPVR
ncbi:hypothetical protein F5882DRAFT_406846 [Hyaloscypha sp. PMI_1271]|nr:hypothetical protein F5882DRAFT_406846 [Hyaloscypha sp. PMI_1271]